MSEPAWERLRAPDHRPLEVGPVRLASVETLRVVHDVLPEHDGAVVFDAWRDGDQTIVRAAAQDGISVQPWQVRTARLDIERTDGRLEALLDGGGLVGLARSPEREACACRGIPTDAAYRTIAAGWATVDAVKRATRIGFGPCQGRRCIPWLAEVLELEPDDPLAWITPRPPLVPVPLSVLAAYAAVEYDGSPAAP